MDLEMLINWVANRPDILKYVYNSYKLIDTLTSVIRILEINIFLLLINSVSDRDIFIFEYIDNAFWNSLHEHVDLLIENNLITPSQAITRLIMKPGILNNNDKSYFLKYLPDQRLDSYLLQTNDVKKLETLINWGFRITKEVSD